MAANWLAIKVELVGGRGDEFWPPSGRLFVVGPRHTFGQLAGAIDDAFARWDRSHLCAFTLADGRTVTDPETAQEWGDSPFGAITVPAPPLDEAVVARLVEVGDEFRYVFDFGDDWTHACTVTELVEPRTTVGISPRRPMAFFGWGSIPDQYGRRWANDPGEGPPPRRPAKPHPMLAVGWPGKEAFPALDQGELDDAVARRDVPAIVAAVEGHDIDAALQQVASAWILVLDDGHDRGEAVAGSLVNRLSFRGAAGDDVLLEDLLTRLRAGRSPA